MAGLDDIRDVSRSKVHAQFALSAIVTARDGSPVGNAQVRLHLADSRPFGDLDREGFGLMIEGKIQLVFDLEELEPQEGYVVDFGRGRVYQVEGVIDMKDRTRYVRCSAVEKKA